MNLKFEVYDYLCKMKEFEINGVEADYEDFGSTCDEDYENAEDYSCGNMKFTRENATDEILKKYNISIEEYNEICDKLDDGLSFGLCGQCI